MKTRVIFGAPGCGKTTRLMGVLEEELRRVPPQEVAFSSFTRKGTYEGTERAKAKFGLAEDELPYFRTLHSLAFRNGGYSMGDMISRRHYREFSEAMGMRFTGYYTEEFYNNDDRYLFAHFLRRNNPEAGARYADLLDARRLRDVETNYARYKEHVGVVDFTDLVEKFVQRALPLPVKVAVIDEAQDLTTLQWRMAEIAFSGCERLYVAGDDDQAIYEWSGADVPRFLGVKGEREVLGRSYRLRRRILESAQRVVRMIEGRVDKRFDPAGDGDGEVTEHNGLRDLEIRPGESYYFLSRNNCFLERYRTELRRRAAVWVEKGEPSYDPQHVEAINAWERSRKAGRETEKDAGAVRPFVAGAHDLSRPWYEALRFESEEAAYYRDLVRTRADLSDRRLVVSTIHGVKGGEADNVVLMLDVTRAVRQSVDRAPSAELRCLYVAMTRAKKRLHVVHSSSREGYDDLTKGVFC